MKFIEPPDLKITAVIWRNYAKSRMTTKPEAETSATGDGYRHPAGQTLLPQSWAHFTGLWSAGVATLFRVITQ